MNSNDIRLATDVVIQRKYKNSAWRFLFVSAISIGNRRILDYAVMCLIIPAKSSLTKSTLLNGKYFNGRNHFSRNYCSPLRGF